ncbi:sodium-dependent neutral amino acid transporter B(0)AT2 isoform X3 [Hydra vulgaris]|uniref:Transporter n=1 Tax=Hydra vulgaris TaxID=6087 RepID=A0ABM4D206_HYDVU
MKTKKKNKRETWSNKSEFILASVGLAVGVGNVWRFPYLCQKNGGGAFLVPYFIMMVFQGLPLFVIEFAIGQRMQKSAVYCWNNIHPALFGVGISCMLVSFAMCSYYIVIITWCFYYLFISFTSELPWQQKFCLNYQSYFNLESNLTVLKSQNQSDPNISNLTNYLQHQYNDFPDCCVRDSAQYYWYNNVLQVSSNLHSSGVLNWRMFGCLLLAWVLVYMCVLKGVKSSGKAAYLTATFPYVILIILFFRGVTLEGAGEGIKVFFKADISVLLKFETWMDAATQIFYSLSVGFGALIAFSSYMPQKNNCIRDAVFIVLLDCGTSVFAGIVTFSFLGYRHFKTGIPVTEVGSGPGLAFMTYCDAFLLMDLSPLWAILFFLMLVLLGIDSEFGTMEGAIAPLYDLKWVTMKKKYFIAIIALIFLIMELIFCLGNGFYLFQIFDDYSVPIPLLVIALFQVISIGWIYGTDRISSDIEYMTGKRPNYFWLICWKYISPLILLIVFIGYILAVSRNTPHYQAYVGCIQDPLDSAISEGTLSWSKNFVYPIWARVLAAFLVIVSVFPIPFYMIKNWPDNWRDGITYIKTKANYFPDPSSYEPKRRITMEEMENIIKAESSL